MLRRNAHPRVGITLIELLVVVAIIGILMSLLMAGVMKAMDSGKRAENTARLTALNSAVGTFKSSASFGQVKYIPPGRLENGQWLPFRLRNSYPVTPTAPGEPDLKSFEAQYIVSVFGVSPEYNPGNGRTEIYDLGYPGLSADLDANQTLTFFLTGIPQVNGSDAVFTGFCNNPQKPFTPRQQPDESRKGPIIDINKGKYVLSSTSPSGLSFASLIDAYGTRFVYFAAYDGQTNKFYGGYNPQFSVQAYQRGGQFENASGLQLISAGKNERFGNTGDWSNVGSDGMDDQANFSSALLGAGPK